MALRTSDALQTFIFLLIREIIDKLQIFSFDFKLRLEIPMISTNKYSDI